MAIKKSELYSSLWQSCDELRGGMDASQYKDYVLVLLFVKYVSDKYAGVPYAPISIPEGASFKDMVALKGKTDIGDQINKKIIGPLANANKLSDMPDFNDPSKLGSGQEIVDRLTNLIAIFENKALDFSKNRAEGDDILGDAYEYLMRHFATESGKSKGQFYTPAEVSRIMAQIIGIREAQTTSNTTVYDPTCGSGSLLLKVGAEARAKVTLYGQEKDAATSGLARMNMILHDNPTALIKQGNTLANPLFTSEDGQLKTFDYVVANPPFSDKRWSTGIDPLNDPHERFKHFGSPPDKQGDYAYLLHIVRSLKNTGKGACILPRGVLSRGNAEADIRKNLIRKGYIKAIIGLPANLFYGTGIPACIIVIDKENAHSRKGIFIVDASSGYVKDGSKNRLRDCDIHQIVDVFNKRLEIPKYSRMVDVEEIKNNDFNLNIPRYIDSQQAEDIQDIEGHLKGGIPCADVNALQPYWDVCPQLRKTLFKANRPGYLDLAVPKQSIKPTIYEHPEFVTFIESMNDLFADWQQRSSETLKCLQPGCHPKSVIVELAEDLLAHYTDKPLINKYDVYQHLMDYWTATMQDDCYLIAVDGWKVETYRIIEKDKKGKEKDKGWTCDLVPKQLIVDRNFAPQQAAIRDQEAVLESVAAQMTEMEEDHSGEDGAFSELDKVNKANVTARLKEIKGDKEETDVLNAWLKLSTQEADLKKAIKEAEAALDALAYTKYPKLTESEIKTLVVEDKWLTTISAAIHGEMDRISQALTQRVKELTERYETPSPKIVATVAESEKKVNGHLKKMGHSLKAGAMHDLVSGKIRLPGFSGEWRRRQLGEVIAHCSSGATPYRGRPDFFKGSVKWITSGELNYNVITETIEHISEDAVEKTNLKIHPVGTFLIAITGLEAAGTRGSCGIVGSPATTNQSCMAIYPTEELTTEFLYHYYVLRGNELALRYCQGTKQQSYTAKLVKLLPIDLPPTIEEQIAIATILSDMDTEIAALEAKLAKARNIKQGMMQELLTGGY